MIPILSRQRDANTPLDGMTGTPSPRRAAATAGCAVSLRNLAQEELKRTEHVVGFQCCSKIGQNGEHRPGGDTHDSVHLSGSCCADPCARGLALLAMPAAPAIHRG